MAEFVLFCLPTLVYLTVRSRGRERTLSGALARAGATWGSPADLRPALLLVFPLLVTGWLAVTLVPAEALTSPGVTIARVTSVGAAIAVVLRAVGEEVFFRGLLGGVLMRRLGLGWGNLLQSALFLVPHLALLLVDGGLWPILPVQFAAGWMLGWLRHRTGSFVPGAAVHVVTNIAAGLLAA
ncbi:CPBP family intramembrane glutamic endopeptidase [Brachybacterium paraconglomeratum]|uniref:CPBP family intramembrane glutamic endopeptidase n=1 Tax=Brachybacterium paraconglomeratum TaxID=173362 RepID=UPI00026C6F88|nr:CPBP family intramembrane glutamic endopeptidase [Brachybacterium paraconglomeratum]